MVSYRVSLYPPFPSNCLGCMAPSVIKNKGTPQMSSLEVLKRERKYNLSKWLNIQIRSSVQQMNPIYDSSIPCLNYHCIIVTEINIIVLYCIYWPLVGRGILLRKISQFKLWSTCIFFWYFHFWQKCCHFCWEMTTFLPEMKISEKYASGP